MPYRFLFGASGAGKSHKLHQAILTKAQESLRAFSDRNYLVIVPEQYTMQTQKDLVLASGSQGILNVDVLSFGRLSHRIFEEVGADHREVLNDIGKSLILQRIASRASDDLPVIGSSLNRQGYVAEVKSVISEFMQYGLSPEDAGRLAEYASGRGALHARLLDLQNLYSRFLNYIHDGFVTNEETLDLLADAIPKSKLVASSVICFDGFTGFTPVQNRVIVQLCRYAREVVIALTLSEDGGRPIPLVEETMDAGGEQELFYLTRKTVADITRLSEEQGIPHGKDVYMPDENLPRFRNNPMLQHLERHFLRYPVVPFDVHEGDPLRENTGEEKIRERNPHDIDSAAASAHEGGYMGQSWAGRGPRDSSSVGVFLYEARTPQEEVRQMFIAMKRMVAEEGYAWRDFAVLAGDLSSYEDPVRRLAALYHVPVYLDVTRAILHNPLTETIRASLDIRPKEFSYEAVFRYLRSGLVNIAGEEDPAARDATDRLENYCLAHGIKGLRKWKMAFDADTEPLRTRFLESISPLLDVRPGATAAERTEALYAFLVKNRMQEKMEQMAQALDASGDPVRADEYRQVYRAVIDLLSEIHDLLGDEKISQKDYLQLVDAGIGEIRLGTLPQQADIVLVGDLERSRLTQVKVLFVLGASDGNIPKGTSKGGLISDLDREFLAGSDIELSPTPRAQMYTQRLYLYLGLTKPMEKLVVSFPDVDSQGRSIRPSYLIPLIVKTFPSVRKNGRIPRPEELPMAEQLVGTDDCMPFIADGLRNYAEGRFDPEEPAEEAGKNDAGAEAADSGAAGGRSTAQLRDSFLTAVILLRERAEEDLKKKTRKLEDAAFRRYTPIPLTLGTAQRLYGQNIEGSVSRLEEMADCFLKQFLDHGLGLSEREEFTFEPADSGTIMHSSLEKFSQELKRRGLSWRDFTPEAGRSITDSCVEEISDSYGSAVLMDTARNTYIIARMQRVLARTVLELQYQIRKGSFDPAEYEQQFGTRNPGAIPGMEFILALKPVRKMYLRGIIDRLDTAVDPETGAVYVKIVDYKSGAKKFDRKAFEAGRQLQLLIYMEAALRAGAKKGKEGKYQGAGEDAGSGTLREILPAALFYYHLSDPYIEDPAISSGGEESEAIERARRSALLPNGLVNGDPAVIRLLDKDPGSGKSDVIPISLNRDGTVSRRCTNVFTKDDFAALLDTTNAMCVYLGQQIIAGNVTAQPYREGQTNACTYCPYSDVCGFDPRVPGYSTKNRNGNR